MNKFILTMHGHTDIKNTVIFFRHRPSLPISMSFPVTVQLPFQYFTTFPWMIPVQNTSLLELTEILHFMFVCLLVCFYAYVERSWRRSVAAFCGEKQLCACHSEVICVWITNYTKVLWQLTYLIFLKSCESLIIIIIIIIINWTKPLVWAYAEISRNKARR